MSVFSIVILILQGKRSRWMFYCWLNTLSWSALCHLHFLWFLWWHAAHRKWTWCTFPGKKRKEHFWFLQFSPRYKCLTDIRVTFWQTSIWGLRNGKKKRFPAFLTRPSPGWILVSWTSSKQADWLIRGSEVVLTVWSQMLFKILDCERKGKTKCFNE